MYKVHPKILYTGWLFYHTTLIIILYTFVLCETPSCRIEVIIILQYTQTESG